MKLFERIQSQNEELNRIQQNVAKSVDPIAKLRLLDGTLVHNLVLAGGGASTDVEHLLGRPSVGWVLTRKRATADIWDDTDTLSDALARLFIRLRASTTVVVDLWVF